MTTEKLKEWESMSRDDLLVLAKESGINVPGNISKDSLIEKLQEVADSAPDVIETDIVEQVQQAEEQEKSVAPVEESPKKMYSEEEVKDLFKAFAKDIKEELRAELKAEMGVGRLPEGMSSQELKAVVGSQIAFTKKQLDEGPHVTVIFPLDAREKRLPVAYAEVGINGVIRKYRKGVKVSVPECMADLINEYEILKDTVGNEFKIDRPKSPDDARPFTVKEALELNTVVELN